MRSDEDNRQGAAAEGIRPRLWAPGQLVDEGPTEALPWVLTALPRPLSLAL